MVLFIVKKSATHSTGSASAVPIILPNADNITRIMRTLTVEQQSDTRRKIPPHTKIKDFRPENSVVFDSLNLPIDIYSSGPSVVCFSVDHNPAPDCTEANLEKPHRYFLFLQPLSQSTLSTHSGASCMKVLMSDSQMGPLNNYAEPSQPSLSQSANLSLLNQLSSTSEPVKRKRGRPPKKLPQQFPMMTLQFSTSADATSPTAELNSNLMVKLGEPDSFTPLMKVSPTIHKKRRRKSSVSTVDTDDLPGKRRGKESEMLTPMSTSSITSSYSRSGFVVDAAAMENISMITGSGSFPHQPYNTPPHLLINSTFSNAGLLRGFREPGSGGGARQLVTLEPRGLNIDVTDVDLQRGKGASVSGVARKYPSLDIRANLTSTLMASSSNLGVNANLANLGNLRNPGKTRISAKGKAALPSEELDRSANIAQGLGDLHALNNHNADRPSQKSDASKNEARTSPRLVLEPHAASKVNVVSFVDDGNFSFQLVVDDLGRATLANRMDSAVSPPGRIHLADVEAVGQHSAESQPPPKLSHAHTAIGIETILQREKPASSTSSSSKTDAKAFVDSKWDRHHPTAVMDDGPEKYIVPQTPKGRDDFYVGYTPKYDTTDALAYNLTPQFNSMMYSMMSINSPQQKKGFSQQPFLHAEAQNAHYGRTNGELASSIDTELLGRRNNFGDVANRSELSSPEEGDARAALKHIFRLKRDT